MYKDTFRIKGVFYVKPTLESDEILATFENDHNAFFGEGHKLATDYVANKLNGKGVVVRKMTIIAEKYHYFDGFYIRCKQRYLIHMMKKEI